MFALNARSINIQSFGTEVSTEKNNVALRFCSFFLRRLDNIPRRLQDGQHRWSLFEFPTLPTFPTSLNYGRKIAANMADLVTKTDIYSQVDTNALIWN